jgi:DNA modification methylase
MTRNATKTTPSDDDTLLPAGHNSAVVITQLVTAELTQSPDDPRCFSRGHIDKAVAIVRRFGMVLPIAVDADGHVLAGWQAVLAARRLGIDHLPALRLDHLSGPRARELSLALNRFLELGTFDRNKLGTLILELEVQVPTFSIADIGFEATEIDLAVAAAVDEVEAETVIAQGPPVTGPGDIWKLGRHRVGHGDATSSDALAAVVAGKQVALLIADPPYGCAVKGFVTSRPHREFVQGSGEMDDAELRSFFSGFCVAALSVLKPGALAYLFIDWRSLPLLLDATRPVFGGLLNLLVWAKDRAGMGSFYRSQHELVLVHRAPGGRHRNNVALGANGRHRSNVLNYACAASFSRSGPEGDLLDGHPTPKSLNLVADLLLDCTVRGDTVLDPFLGSGTTLIAAEKTGRVCFGLDLDPLYVDLAVRRWQAWTGEAAVDAVTGERFAEREAAAVATAAALLAVEV